MEHKKNITFADIAEYTHFSKTTISRYFNNPDSLTLENQQKIADALVALDYKENKVARILANGKTEFVGIIIPNLFLSYYSEVLNQILTTYETYGYKFLVFLGNDNKETERRYIEELLAYKIEGLIILSHTLSSKELAAYNIPIVTIERENQYVCSVNTDNYMGGVQATSLLIKGGCNFLIHINQPVVPETPAYGRIKGFEDICSNNNIPHETLLRYMDDTYSDTQKELAEIFQYIEETYPRQKKGIFLSNDTLASIFLNLILKKYGSLPDTYQIVGFDDSPIASQYFIPISTVRQKIDVIVREAMKLLVMQMDERKKRRPTPLKKPIHKIVTPVLIQRQTTVS